MGHLVSHRAYRSRALARGWAPRGAWATFGDEGKEAVEKDLARRQSTYYTYRFKQIKTMGGGGRFLFFVGGEWGGGVPWVHPTETPLQMIG